MKLLYLRVPNDGELETGSKLEACPLVLAPDSMPNPLGTTNIPGVLHLKGLNTVGVCDYAGCEIAVRNSATFGRPITNIRILGIKDTLIRCEAVSSEEDETADLVMVMIFDLERRLRVSICATDGAQIDLKSDTDPVAYRYPALVSEYTQDAQRPSYAGQGESEQLLISTRSGEPLSVIIDGHTALLLVVQEPKLVATVLAPAEAEEAF